MSYNIRCPFLGGSTIGGSPVLARVQLECQRSLHALLYIVHNCRITWASVVSAIIILYSWFTSSHWHTVPQSRWLTGILSDCHFVLQAYVPLYIMSMTVLSLHRRSVTSWHYIISSMHYYISTFHITSFGSPLSTFHTCLKWAFIWRTGIAIISGQSRANGEFPELCPTSVRRSNAPELPCWYMHIAVHSGRDTGAAPRRSKASPAH